MLSPFRLTAAALVMLAAGLVNTGVQAPQGKETPPAKGPAAGALTTGSGVYSAQQAMRGEITYMTLCVTCHPPGTYALPEFKKKWNGAPLVKLFDLVADTMPKNEPGSLSPEEYADAIAYILRLNKMPAGKTELTPNPAALRRIRIEFK